MRKDGWAELPLHLMTISCQDERKSSEEDERPETEHRVSTLPSAFPFFSFISFCLESYQTDLVVSGRSRVFVQGYRQARWYHSSLILPNEIQTRKD